MTPFPADLHVSNLLIIFLTRSSEKNHLLLPLIRHGPHWKRRVQQFFCFCVCIHYRGNVSTKPLSSNDRGIFTEPSRYLATIVGYTYRHTDWWEGFFNKAVEMSSGAVTYVPSFIKIGSGVQKLIGGYTDTHTQTATWSYKSTLFFQNKEVQVQVLICLATGP
jgi:hypothetical protein